MCTGQRLLDLARAAGARCIFMAGTGKNSGKTVAMRAIADAVADAGLVLGLTSTGRDGEAVDAMGQHRKPRLFLRPGTIIATAEALLPAHPAAEVLDLTGWQTAAGRILFVRVRRGGYFELAGPSSAAGIARARAHFERLGCTFTIVDGALDRLAALSAGGKAIVVSAGAASASTIEESVEQAGSLVRRLRIPAYDPREPFVRLDVPLTAAVAARLGSLGEKRQVVVPDPTHVAASAGALPGILDRLDVRCERAFNVIAATVASIGPSRYFEPRAFALGVARATGLPVFDVYAGTETHAA